MLHAVLLIGFLNTTCGLNCTSVNSRNGVVGKLKPRKTTTLTLGPSAHQLRLCIESVCTGEGIVRAHRPNDIR